MAVASYLVCDGIDGTTGWYIELRHKNQRRLDSWPLTLQCPFSLLRGSLLCGCLGPEERTWLSLEPTVDVPYGVAHTLSLFETALRSSRAAALTSQKKSDGVLR